MVIWTDPADRFPLGNRRWVVHLPINVTRLSDAMALATEVADWLADLPLADGASVEVSRENDQTKRYPVFCGRRVAGRRCGRRRGHGGKCRPRAPRPAPEPEPDQSELAE